MYVGLVRTCQGVSGLAVHAQVGDLHLAQQLDRVGRHLLGVEHAGVGQDVLLVPYLAEQPPVRPSRGVILEILAQVALVASLRELVLCLGQLHLYEVLQFSHELVVAFL